MMLAQKMNISPEQALDIFYSSLIPQHYYKYNFLST